MAGPTAMTTGLFNNGDEPDGVPKWNPGRHFMYVLFHPLPGDRQCWSAPPLLIRYCELRLRLPQEKQPWH